MKHKKIIALLLMTLMVISLAGCAEKKKEDKSKTSDEVKEADVVIDFLEDNDTDKLEGWNEYTDPQYEGSEYLTAVLITTDAPIKNVQFMNVEMGDATGEIPEYRVNAIVHEEAEIKADTPYLYWTEFPNFMPNLVISYLDPTGEEKVFSIAMSGEDSSIVVDPAVIEDEDMAQAHMTIDYLTDEMFNSLDAFEEYTDQIYGNDEHTIETLITTDIAIHDIKIMDGEVKETEEDHTEFAVHAILFECDSLEPDKPLVYKTQFPGTMPDRLISYIDADEEEKVFYMSMSGEDSSLNLSPAEIEK